MAKEYRFEARIQAGKGGGAWVEVPLDVRKEFGTGGRVGVEVTFDGEPYRGSLAPMGGRGHVLGIRKSIRERIGKDIGDEVTIVLREDTAPRTVAHPRELAEAFERRPEARPLFERLSYTRRREQAEWVAGAKKEETRRRRAARVVDELLEGTG